MRHALAGLAAAWFAASAVRASVVSEAFRADASRVRAAFVAVGMGARPVGMGEAFTAVADDASAVTWNPGGLGQMREIRAVATHDLAGEGIGLGGVAAAVPLGPGAIGVGCTVLFFGAYSVRAEDGADLGTENVTDVAATVAYGLPNPGWLGGRGGTGLGVEVVKETLSGTLVGVNAGGIFPIGSLVTVGWSAQHIGAAQDGFALPATVKAGAAFLVGGVLRVCADAGYRLVSRKPLLAGGAEFRLRRFFVVRAGYKWQGAETGLAGLTGVTAGMGIRLSNLGLDYAYQPFGDLTTSHRLAVVYRGDPPGSHEEKPAPVEPEEKPGLGAPEMLPQEEAPASQVPPPSVEEAYLAAMDAYAAQRYEECRATAEALIRRDPMHWRAWALLGNALYFLGDRPGAIATYDHSLALNPDNAELRAWRESLRTP